MHAHQLTPVIRADRASRLRLGRTRRNQLEFSTGSPKRRHTPIRLTACPFKQHELSSMKVHFLAMMDTEIGCFRSQTTIPGNFGRRCGSQKLLAWVAMWWTLQTANLGFPSYPYAVSK